MTNWHGIQGVPSRQTERPLVANKDKGGKSTKKVAAKDLKEKRQAKKVKS